MQEEQLDLRGRVAAVKAYMERQWRPLPADQLSVFGLERRTNNDAESFASFGATHPTAHPGFWGFMAKTNMVRNEIVNSAMLKDNKISDLCMHSATVRPTDT